jgi:hypothetical protein
MRSAFIHEEDQGQVELLPGSCWRFCEGELSRIAQEQADTGDKWAEIRAFALPPHHLGDVRITMKWLCRALGEDYRTVRRVIAGDGWHRWRLPDAVAYTFQSAPAFFVHRNRHGYVTSLWLEPYVHSKAMETAMEQTVLGLGKAHQLLLVDRLLKRLAHPGDAASLSSYFRSRVDHARELSERMREHREPAGRQGALWRLWG